MVGGGEKQKKLFVERVPGVNLEARSCIGVCPQEGRFNGPRHTESRKKDCVNGNESDPGPEHKKSLGRKGAVKRDNEIHP